MRLDQTPVSLESLRSYPGELLTPAKRRFRRRCIQASQALSAERDQLQPTFSAAMLSYALQQPDMLHVQGYAYSEFVSLCYGFGYI